MAQVGKGYTFGSTELVTAAKLHSLVDLATVTDIAFADFATNVRAIWSAATPPVTPSAGTMWFDTTTSTLYVYDGSGWLLVGNGFRGQAKVALLSGDACYFGTDGKITKGTGSSIEQRFAGVSLQALDADAYGYFIHSGITQVVAHGAIAIGDLVALSGTTAGRVELATAPGVDAACTPIGLAITAAAGSGDTLNIKLLTGASILGKNIIEAITAADSPSSSNPFLTPSGVTVRTNAFFFDYNNQTKDFGFEPKLLIVIGNHTTYGVPGQASVCVGFWSAEEKGCIERIALAGNPPNADWTFHSNRFLSLNGGTNVPLTVSGEDVTLAFPGIYYQAVVWGIR
jgi:hypothetical protein